jgi:hypothetical protein
MYVLTSSFALALGALSWTQYLLRLHFIRENTEPSSLEAAEAEQSLRDEGFDTEDEWALGDPIQVGPESEPRESRLYVPQGPRAPVLHFLAAVTIGLPHWQFHLGDRDFSPSIPHGHWDTDGRKKLDAYRGWVFRHDKQIDREPRRKIIALWNDEKFRSFASRAIEHYMTAFPGHVWRVRNPMLLPHRR